MEFVEQPLDASIGFLSAITEAPMRVADRNIAADRISFVTASGGLPLDVLLDLISLEYDLIWEIDETGAVLIKPAPPDRPGGEARLPRTHDYSSMK
jgi:hypothetical protein